MVRKHLKSTLLLALAAVNMLACSTKKIDKAVALSTAKDAYIYGLPLVLTDLTRIGSGTPSNEFHHRNDFPDHTFRWVVRPNNDTYYSSAFLDLGNEPIVLHIPDTKDRYAVVPLMDAWTNVFASFGKRNTGTKEQTYIVTGPKWKGELPAGIQEVKAPTDEVWIIGRIQVNSPEDGKNFVVPLQQGLTLTPLSRWGKDSTDKSRTSVTVKYSIEKSETIQQLKDKKINVVEALKKLTTEEYFNYLNELLIKNPPLEADKDSVVKFEQIGIKAGAKFDLNAFDAATQEELKGVSAKVIEGLESLRTLLKDKKDGKPDLTIGHYGTNYKKRASVAYFGLGALGPEDAVYQGYSKDEEGKPLTGVSKYVLHFEKGQTPPARAFWSITLYDKEGFLAANDIRRYAIGDRSNLKYNKDGSLDIYIQNENPGKEKEANWLPAPKDEFSLSVRIYWATEEFLKTGNWTKPPIQKAD